MARKTFSMARNTAPTAGKAYGETRKPASSGTSAVNTVNAGKTVTNPAYDAAKAIGSATAARVANKLKGLTGNSAKSVPGWDGPGMAPPPWMTTAPRDANGNRISIEQAVKERTAQQWNDYQKYKEAQRQEQEVNPYDQQLAHLEQWMQNQTAYINANVQAAIDAVNAGRGGIETDYADAMREAYIAQQKNKLASSDYLNAMGYSGGMAESTLADIDNTYQNNRLAGYKARQNALSQLDSQVAEARNTGNNTLANLSDSYYDKYTSLLDSKRKYEYQKEQDEYQKSQDKQEQANLDRQFKYDKQQDKLKQKNYKQKLKEERYEASLSGRYKTVKGAQNAIKSIKKSGKNTWKIPYIYERIGEIRKEQAEAAKKKVGSSSGSSKYYSPKSGDTNAIRIAAKNYVNKHPGVAVNSATVDYYLGTTDYSGAQKEAFKAYMQRYGAGYIRRR